MTDTLGAVESVKAASDVYAPISGKVVEVNSKLESEPSLINSSPLSDGMLNLFHSILMWTGWISKIQLSNSEQTKELLNEKSYNEYIQDL